MAELLINHIFNFKLIKVHPGKFVNFNTNGEIFFVISTAFIITNQYLNELIKSNN